MCGIAGIISLNPNNISVERIKKMTDIIKHRGPDGDGQWVSDDGRVGFGHRRLSIIDLSETGGQPMHYMQRYTITFNGEIYNYIELKEQCVRQGYSFHSHSDTEVIMAMYDWKGADCLQYFDGMFAFALYDANAKNIFIARDRFGEKPFYYHIEKGQSIYFGSEMKALWAAGVKREVNPQMLYNYMAFSYIENPADQSETFFENILRLPQAHYINIDISSLSVSIKKYWDVDPNIIDYSISYENAANKFRELFYTSVSRRLRSDVPVGSSLSGGLDSSAVVAVIDDLNKEKQIKQNTFSAIFPGFEKDESKYINLLLSHLNVSPHFTIPDSDTMLNDLADCFYHQEEPFGSASILAQYEVMKLAKKNNVTVLLDGQGADELLAGYPPFYGFFFQELKKTNVPLYKNELKSYYELHNNNVVNPIPKKDAMYYARKWSGPAKNKLKGIYGGYKQIVNPYFNKEFYHQYQKKQYILPNQAETLNQFAYQNVKTGLSQLLRYGDRNSMAHSREVRLPFLSHELAEFVFTLPATFKIHNGWTKYIQRIAFEQLLPPEITWRKDKIGYEPPQKKWMEQEKIKEVILETRKKLVNDKILDPTVLKKTVVGESANKKSDNSWSQLMVAHLFNL